MDRSANLQLRPLQPSPGPRGWPLVGNAFNVDLARLHLSVADHKQKYGAVSYVNFCGIDIVSLNTIDALKEALTDAENKTTFAGRPTTFTSEYVVPNNIAAAPYSRKWAKLRRVVHTMITPYSQDIKRIETVVTEELRVLKNDLENTAGQPFDIYERLLRSIGNIILILLAGKRYAYDHDIHKLTQDFVDLSNRINNPFTTSLLTTFPFLRHVPFGGGKIYKDLQTNVKALLAYVCGDMKDSGSENKKGLVYELNKKLTEDEWMTDDNIRDVVGDVMLAGIATTSVTLNTIFLILLHRRDVQKRLHAEVDSVVGRDREPCLDDQADMPYTWAVIIEALRYAALLPTAIPHATIDDVTFRGFRLKKGTMVLPNAWSIQHDEDLWEEPWTFKPERFLDENGQLVPVEHDTRRNLVTFGLGKRRCIGEVFARNRLFLFVTHLCQRFAFFNDRMDSVPSADPRGYDTYFLVMPNPYKIQVSVRD